MFRANVGLQISIFRVKFRAIFVWTLVHDLLVFWQVNFEVMLEIVFREEFLVAKITLKTVGMSNFAMSNEL